MQVQSQRRILTNEEIVKQEVTGEVDALFASEAFVRKKQKIYPDVEGSMTIDVGVVQNGKVSTFYIVESDIENIDFINFMSDYILKYKFNFKLKKQQRYKIRYSCNFKIK